MNLRSIWPGRLLAAAAILLGLAAAPSWAEEKPVLVVAANSLKAWLADFEYLADVAEMPEWKATIAGAFQNDGVDLTRPVGLVGSVDGTEVSAFAFVPISDLEKFTALLSKQTGEEFVDIGEGVLKSGRGKSALFIKEQRGWAFIGWRREHLKNLPEDPEKIVGPLLAKYDLGAEVLVQNFSRQMRTAIMAELREANQQMLGGGLEDPDEKWTLTRELNRRVLRQFEVGLQEAESLHAGFSIDAAGKSIFAEWGFAVKDGGSMSRELALQRDVRTNLAGFQLPGSAARWNLTSGLSPETIESLLTDAKKARKKFFDEWAELGDMPDEQAQKLKGVFTQILDVAEATARSGKIDAGALLSLDPEILAAAAGVELADGAAVEKILRFVDELQEKKPGLPAMQFKAERHHGVTFHSLKFPSAQGTLPDKLGTEVELVVGTGEKSVYAAIGKNPRKLLKQVIDYSAAHPNQPVSSMEISVSLVPIFHWIGEFDLKKGMLAQVTPILTDVKNDRFYSRTRVEGNQLLHRMAVEDGVVRSVARGIKLLLNPPAKKE